LGAPPWRSGTLSTNDSPSASSEGGGAAPAAALLAGAVLADAGAAGAASGSQLPETQAYPAPQSLVCSHDCSQLVLVSAPVASDAEP
jgi:hypothetical protein